MLRRLTILAFAPANKFVGCAAGEVLDGFEISREEAETLIMTSRVKAGWIDSIPDREAADLFVNETDG